MPAPDPDMVNLGQIVKAYADQAYRHRPPMLPGAASAVDDARLGLLVTLFLNLRPDLRPILVWVAQELAQIAPDEGEFSEPAVRGAAPGALTARLLQALAQQAEQPHARAPYAEP